MFCYVGKRLTFSALNGLRFFFFSCFAGVALRFLIEKTSTENRLNLTLFSPVN